MDGLSSLDCSASWPTSSPGSASSSGSTSSPSSFFGTSGCTSGSACSSRLRRWPRSCWSTPARPPAAVAVFSGILPGLALLAFSLIRVSGRYASRTSGPSIGRHRPARSTRTPGLVTAQRLLLALRIPTETGVVAGLAWWGYQTGGAGGTGLLLAIGAPAIGFGIWGAVDFHQAGRYAEPLRLAEELIISGLAAWALFAIGHPIWGGGLLAVSVVYHGSVYAAGERLLRATATAPQRGNAHQEPT